MIGLDMTDSQVMSTFDRVCHLTSRRGRGLSLSEIGDAHALARELHSPEPDGSLVEDLSRRLELGPEDLEGLEAR